MLSQHLTILQKFIGLSNLLRFHLPFSKVTGQPFNEPKGRWRVGGGINVSLNVTFEDNKTQATEIERTLTKNQEGYSSSIEKRRQG